MFADVTQTPGLTESHLYQSCDHDASEEQSWRVSHQQGNAPASKQHTARLPTTHWPELTRGLLNFKGGGEREASHMRGKRGAQDMGEQLECLPQALRPKADSLPGEPLTHCCYRHGRRRWQTQAKAWAHPVLAQHLISF